MGLNCSSDMKTTCNEKSFWHMCRRRSAVAPVTEKGRRENKVRTWRVKRIPLTEKEVLAVMQSWTRIQSHIIEAGMRMFLSMLQSNVAAKLAFEKFRTINDSETLWKSSVLETHGLVVMSAIDEIITNLDDEQTVYELICEQGQSHVRFGDLSAKLFWAIRDPFLDAVRITLENHHTTVLHSLYTRVIDYIIDVLIDSFELKRQHRQRTGSSYCLDDMGQPTMPTH